MAGGCNKKFRNNPKNFFTRTEFRFTAIFPVLDGRSYVDLQDAGAGNVGRNIAIKPWVDRPGRPTNLNPGRFFPGPAPIVAYCLNARQNRPDAATRAIAIGPPLPALGVNQGMVDLGPQANFFFTDEMTGCMLSVYGPSILTAPRVEHMNFMGPNQQAQYINRKNMILNAYPNARILARTGTCLPAGIPGVTYYNNYTWVFGMRIHRQWDFWYHTLGDATLYRL